MPSPVIRKKESARQAYAAEQEYAQTVLPESEFLRALCFERKRTERSGRPFVLMLFEGGRLFEKREVGEQLSSALLTSIRDTDLLGWYRTEDTMAALFTEISDPSLAEEAIFPKVLDALGERLPSEILEQIRITVHHFPEEPGGKGSGDLVLYPDLTNRNQNRKASRGVKRAFDIVGSSALLFLLSPLLLLIALAVKITSKGPVLFRQRRVGQYGQEFDFLKFRSMFVNNDDTVHREYVQKFIAGNGDIGNGKDKRVFKLTRDPRVTSVGRILRRTSLDELPQFFNVLKGEMSLVGPRPPLPYEVERYQSWHRRRILEAPPGITGLWQVSGRSRLTFDEMVRLDLQYIDRASFALDLQILLRTPFAVMSGDGAY
jgi:lipopolysaccharide/colanic/teichoic acid biosynthesis glycosyltransferase